MYEKAQLSVRMVTDACDEGTVKRVNVHNTNMRKLRTWLSHREGGVEWVSLWVTRLLLAVRSKVYFAGKISDFLVTS